MSRRTSIARALPALLVLGLVLLGPRFVGAATLVFGQPAYTAQEGTPDLSLTVVLTVGPNECGGFVTLPAGTFNVQAVATGSAAADVDFVAGPSQNASPLVQGTAGQIVIPGILNDLILPDDTTEGAETFQLELVLLGPVFCDIIAGTTPTIPVVLGGPATVTIEDDDPEPEITVEGTSNEEGDEGTAPFELLVSLSNPSAFEVTVDFATEDGSATAGADYEATSGTLMFPPGETQAAIEVLVNGDTADEQDETFAVVLSNPANATFSETGGEAFGLIVDDDAAPTVSIGNAEVTEDDAGEAVAVFRVTLSVPSGLEVTVEYATTDGSATGGEDFQPSEGTLTFAPGETEKTIEIPITGDLTPEDDESFFVELLSATNAELGDAKGRGTITNNDLPTISIGDSEVMESEQGPVDTFFPVTLSAAHAVPVRVDFATADGTATDEDYVVRSGRLEIPPGETEGEIRVRVRGDQKVEDDETFFVDLTNPIHAVLGDERGTGTIVDNDEAEGPEVPEVSIGDVRVVEGDAGTTDAFFDVTLSAASEATVRVDFATENGRARAGRDYDALSGTVNFPPGTTEAQVRVAVRGDTRDERDEDFFVVLADPANATIGDVRGMATIVDDDDEPSFTIGDVTRAEGDSGVAVFTFAIELRPASGRSTSVGFRTRDGTAVAGEDYRARSGRVSFGAGETVKNVTVEGIGDADPEDDEVFFLDLFDPANATIVDGEGAATITNDDEAAPSDIVVVSGDGQTGLVNQPLAEPFVVEVTNENGPLEGVEVSWAVTTGDATLTDALTVTGADGRSSNQAILGELTGDVLVSARVTDLAVGFSATAQVADSALFDEVAGPVASALNVICGRTDLSPQLREICNTVAAAGGDEGLAAPGSTSDAASTQAGTEDQGELLRALAPWKVSSQGQTSIEAQGTQMQNISSRLGALRSGARTSTQIALNLGDVRLSGTQIAGIFSQEDRRQLDLAGVVDRQLYRAIHPNAYAQEGTPPAAPGSDLGGRLGFFINGTIGEGNRPGTVREPGFDFDTEGVTTGIDYRVSDQFTFGGAVGYVSDDVELSDDGGGLDVEGYSVSLYGTYYRTRLYVDGMLSFGSNDFDMERVIDFAGTRHVARTAPGGDQLALSLGLGYDGQVGSWTLGGFGRFDYVDATIDAFAEQGAPGFNLAVGEQTVESLVGSVGFQLSYAASLGWGVLMPTVRLGVYHEFEDDSRPLEARFVDDPGMTTFVIPTDDPDRDYFNLGLGLSAVMKRGRQAFLFYEKDLDRDDLNLYLITVGLRFEF